MGREVQALLKVIATCQAEMMQALREDKAGGAEGGTPDGPGTHPVRTTAPYVWDTST